MFDHVMTVARLCDGNVLLHSPCAPSASLLDEVAAIGRVTQVIAPSWFHDLYLREYRDAFPSAAFWAPRSVANVLPKIIDRVFDQDPTPWGDEMPHAMVPGLVTFNEYIFFHVPSRTLIVADLLTTVGSAGSDSFTRMAFRLTGLDGRLRTFPYLRLLRFTVARTLRETGEQIARWDPTGIIVGHGAPVPAASASDIVAALQR